MQVKNAIGFVSSVVKAVNDISKSEKVNTAIRDSQNFSELVGKFVQIGLSKFAG